MQTSPTTKGIFTSEFFIAFIARLGGLGLTYLLLTSRITSSDVTGFTNVIIAVVALLSPVIAESRYIQGRTEIKQTLLNLPK